MATITPDNVQIYIDSGLIDPDKVKIDLNKTKVARDNVHRWVTLSDAIKQGYDFNFDYNVSKEIKTPTIVLLPEVIVNASLKSDSLNQNEPKNTHFYDYAVKNFTNTFGITPKEAAEWLPLIGDGVALYDIVQDLNKGNYGNAALGAGLFVLPNFIEKPFKYVVRKGKQLYRHLVNPVIDKGTYLRYSKSHLLDQYGTNLSEDLIKKRNKLIVSNLNHENLKTLSEVLLKHNIIKDGESYILNGKPLTSEESELLIKAPVYYDWALSVGLNPTSKDTVKTFINKLGTSIRGVVTTNPDDAITYLSSQNPNVMNIGGDRFKSKRGIYTSNSNAIGIHYADLNTLNPKKQSFIGNLTYDYLIDPNLSVLEQLELLSGKDVLFDVFPYIKYENTKLIPRGYRFPNAGVESFSLNYKNYSRDKFNASEKVFFQPQTLTNVTYLGNHRTLGKQKDWYKYGVDPDFLYFSRFTVNSPSVQQRYFNIADLVIDKIPNSTVDKFMLEKVNRINWVNNLRKRLKRNVKLTGIGLGSGTILGLGGAGYYLLEDSPEEYNNETTSNFEVLNIYSDWENLK